MRGNEVPKGPHPTSTLRPAAQLRGHGSIAIIWLDRTSHTFAHSFNACRSFSRPARTRPRPFGTLLGSLGASKAPATASLKAWMMSWFHCASRTVLPLGEARLSGLCNLQSCRSVRGVTSWSRKPGIYSLIASPARRRKRSNDGHLHLLSTSAASTITPKISRPGVHVSKTSPTPNSTVATITISNPAKLNIVNSSILAQLTAASTSLASDTTLRAVILAGSPSAPGKAPSFIGGADIREMHAISSPSEARTFILRIHEACQALRDLPVPVIARVHGFALGAGLEIMAACDLRVATRASAFGMPEVKIGIPSVVEAALLPGLIGLGRTRRLLYLAETIDADVAERWGLVERVVDGEEELDRAVQEWIGRLIEMGPKAIRSQKRLMLRWEEGGLKEGIEAGVEAFAEAFEDGGIEPRELMQQFLAKKK